MGLYRAVGRPLFFALPPEAAHRAAGAVLRLPLPWRAIGGFTDDPVLHVTLAGIQLRNPVGLAAGFDKSCRFLPALGDLGFGYVVGGSLTRAPREGNAKPRIVRRPAEKAIVNAMGLPNRGAAYAAGRLRRPRRTSPVIVSLAAEEVENVVAAHAGVEPQADGIELNVSSPSLAWTSPQERRDHVSRILEALRPPTQKPLFVKLPPPADDPAEVLALARAAMDHGADGLTCFNTMPVAEPRLSTGRGGLSGPPLSERTISGVRDVRSEIGSAVPINACGGITTAADALACLEAGATTVQLYTALIYEGPRIVRAITRGLARTLRERRATASSPRATADS
jgi:dihydroorotate dehydrogenase subfamily 1